MDCPKEAERRMASETQSVIGNWASVKVYILVFCVHCPDAISSRRDWDQVQDDAHAQRALRSSDRSQVSGFQRTGCPCRSSASTKYVSGKYLRQVEATEVSKKTDEVRVRKDLKLSKGEINSEVVPSRG